MAEPAPQKSWLLNSRKGLVFLMVVILVGIAATGFEIALVVLSIRGRMSIEAAMGLAFGGVIVAAVGAIVAGVRLIDAIASEDNAKRVGGSLAVSATVTTPEQP